MLRSARSVRRACLVAVLLCSCGSDHERPSLPAETWAVQDESGPGPSRQDPFYLPPDPLPSGGPGEVVRSEIVPDFDPDGRVVAVRVLYHSISIHGGDIAVSGLVLIPPGNPPEAGWPVLGWAHGTTGVGDACAPSKWGDLYEYGDYVLGLARAGFVIAASDYEGLGVPGPHPYHDASSEAHGVIDAVRAATQLVPEASRRWLAIGHSQGGQAALAAGEHATEWAPELEYLGTVGIAPSSSLRLLPAMALTPTRGYVAFFAAGMLAVDPGVTLDDLLGPEAVARTEILQSGCWYEVMDAYRGISPSQLFPTTPAGRAATDAFFQRNEPGTLPLGKPILLVQGSLDFSVPVFVTQALHTRLCDNDETVTLSVYPGFGHDGVLAPSFEETIGWIRARVAREVADSDCGE
ncbi:MAG: lipase family protein [bacterium]